MNPLLGYFIFQNMGDDCFASKYCHRHLLSPHPETMKRMPPNNEEEFEINANNQRIERNDFIGRFRTTWIQDLNDRNSEIATVTISPKVDTPGIFLLQWDNLDNTPIFFGEGMIHNGILLGSYWDENINAQFAEL